MINIVMRLLVIALALFVCFCSPTRNKNEPRSVQETPVDEQHRSMAGNERSYLVKIKKLIDNYPGIITGFRDNMLVFHDGSLMLFDDGEKNKKLELLLNNPDIEDQFHFSYPVGQLKKNPERNEDPGRIRNEEFFKKVYGNSEDEVRNKLVDVEWCPGMGGGKVKFSCVNGAHCALARVSSELDFNPELCKYLRDIGGTFNWRFIRGTTRMSAHSFGIAIDINVSCSNYWQWDCGCQIEQALLTYRNRIPRVIVDAFERNGFIWGGKWYHYDTMHFEYRPELIGNKSRSSGKESTN